MKVIRMYTGSDNRSHLEELAPLFEPMTEVSQGATLLRADADDCSIRTATKTMPNLHPAPRRQYLVILEGTVDFIVGDGQKMELGTGDVVQVEDTEGEGHLLKFRGGCERYVFFFAPLPT